MNTNLVAYYKDRAEEYEKIYAKPERQDDLAKASALLENTFAGRNVLEIACGTGYWTERIAGTAASILATDINEAVINIAQRKGMAPGKVSFAVANMYDLPQQHQYESLFGGFIWSHIGLQDIDRFLAAVSNLVVPGGTVVFMDNNFVAGSNLSIAHTDDSGNTYQARQLEDGTTHLILKNFPAEDTLRQMVHNVAPNIHIVELTYYWILSYTTPLQDR